LSSGSPSTGPHSNSTSAPNCLSSGGFFSSSHSPPSVLSVSSVVNRSVLTSSSHPPAATTFPARPSLQNILRSPIVPARSLASHCSISCSCAQPSTPTGTPARHPQTAGFPQSPRGTHFRTRRPCKLFRSHPTSISTTLRNPPSAPSSETYGPRTICSEHPRSPFHHALYVLRFLRHDVHIHRW
jgi:hypothetical protein